MENREYRTGHVKAVEEDSRTVRFTISDESIDRHNSIIKLDAWDLEAFKENPIAGWGHSVYGGWRAPDPDDIIGKWDVWTEDKELVGDLTFEDAETNPKADKLYRKVKNGTLNAVSVGFMPQKSHKGDSKEREGEIDGITYYDSAELVEVSLVVIPSNKNARKKAFENDDISELIEDFIKEALGDEYRDDLTLKGLFTILNGGDAAEIEEADTGEEIDAEAREENLQKSKNINNYFELEEKYRDELKRDY